MRAPLNGSPRMSNQHGTPGWGRFGRHTGVDYAVPVGTPVYAPAEGTIRSTGNAPSGGIQMELAIGKYWHRFLHLSRIVKKSGTFKKGELLAYSGNTGETTGSHLHWDVRNAGTAWDASYSNYVDPLTLIQQTTNPHGGDMSKTDKGDLDAIYRYGPLGRTREPGEGEDVYLGVDPAFVLKDHYDSAPARQKRAELAEQAKQAKRVPGLEREIADLKERLKAASTPQKDADPALVKKARNWDDFTDIVKRAA